MYYYYVVWFQMFDRKAYNKNYRETHKEYYKDYKKNYRQTHREQILEYYNSVRKLIDKQYRSSFKGKETNQRHKAKHRKLGFIPLNKLFADSEPHHIDKMFVIYIPKELHRSIYHNVWTGKGMMEINTKVFEWLEN